MTNPTITRAGSRARAASLRVNSYRVLVDLSGRGPDGVPLDAPDATFLSTTTVSFTSDGSPTYIDLIADRVLSAHLDETELNPASYGDQQLPIQPKTGENRLTVIALCRYSHTGEGLHRFVDPVDGRVYLFSQFESADARRMFATFEQPDLKAPFELAVIAPAAWQVVSNGLDVEPTPLPDGFAAWEFAPTTPLATYVMALVAGEYHVVHDTIPSVAGDIPASLLCRQSVAEHLDGDRILTTTRRGFEVFEKHFGCAYPFDHYATAFVPEFNFGAMENAGCVVVRDETLFRSRVTLDKLADRDNMLLHELAHMWFGDLVTMHWWDDLWLNESFAEWAAYWCQAEITARYGGTDPWVGFANSRKGWAYLQDQLPTTHPIAADMVDLATVEQNFDGITYAKGASVLKQLVAQVGQDNFLAGVHEYLAAHSFGNAELADLLGALQRASGRDLSGFSGEWLETAGVNTIQVDADVDQEGRYTRFDVVQSADPAWPTLRSHTLRLGCYERADDQLRSTDSLEVDIRGERTPIAAMVGRSRPALLLPNDEDLTYAKLRLDATSLQTALDHIDKLADPLARGLIWNAAWDMCRDGELAPQAYLSLVLHGVGGERDLTAVNTLVGRAHTAAVTYTAPELRAASRSRFVAGLAQQLKDAEAGSDHQLAFANGLVEAVHTPAGAELIRGWLDDEEVPPGLVIDTDMRWRILGALARMGDMNQAELDAEGERDQTISGTESAAAVASTWATPDAKNSAWRLATEVPDLPNATHRAICAAFWHAGQEDLTRPYAHRYLDVATSISRKEGDWATRGTAAEQAVLTSLFPRPVADADFLQELDAWLDAEQPSDSVRRSILESRDQARRALRNQEVSRQFAR